MERYDTGRIYTKHRELDAFEAHALNQQDFPEPVRKDATQEPDS